MQLAAVIISFPLTIIVLRILNFLGYDTVYSYDQLFWFIGLLAGAIYLFIEPWIIILTGTTFGKFSLGIRVLTSSYDRSYTYRSLLKRGLLMLVKGMGFNIPIANIVALIWAKSHVEDDDSGQASWDYDCGVLISYRELRRINYILIVVNVLISIGTSICSLL